MKEVQAGLVSGRGPNILRISFFSCLYESLFGNSVSDFFKNFLTWLITCVVIMDEPFLSRFGQNRTVYHLGSIRNFVDF